METYLEESLLSISTSIPLDRAVVLVRAPLEHVVHSLAPFAGRAAPADAGEGLLRGIGLDALLGPPSGRRAVVYRPRGADYTGVIREGGARLAHDVPLARRLSRELSAPAIALHVAARDVSYSLFHEGRLLERLLCLSGEVVTAEGAFDLDASQAARDPYGRALALLRAYGLEDEQLSFEDFARGDLAFRRWDVTIGECLGFPDLAAWPVDEELSDTGSWKAQALEAA